MSRIVFPLLLALLLAFWLRAPAGDPVPGKSWLQGGSPSEGKLRTVLSFTGPVEGRISLTQAWIPLRAEGELQLVTELRGQRPEVMPPRPPLNLVLVLDRSGSMRVEGKMKQALLASAEVVRGLRRDDVFGLVTYSTDAELALPPRRVGDGREALEALERIRPGGSTNISEALDLALQEAARFSSRERITRILLLSDGKANHGLTKASELAELARKIRQQGFSLTSMGLGATYDELILQEMARQGGGNYAFLESGGDASRAFVRELDSLRNLAVRGAYLLVTPAPGVKLTAGSGYPVDVLPGGALRIRLGEIAQGEIREALVRLSLPPGEEGTILEPVRVRLGFQSFQQSWTEGAFEEQFQLGYSQDTARQQSSRDSWALARVEEVRTAEVLEQAVGDLERGTLSQASQRLRDIADQVDHRNRVLYQDRALGEQLEQIRRLAGELGETSQKQAAVEVLVKRGRAQAFVLSR